MLRLPVRFFYGWIVVGVTALTLVLSAGIRSAPGVLLLPLQNDIGWSRSIISFAVSIGLILFGFAGPFAGWLMDRFGPRRLMLAGIALVVVSMLASATMRNVWQLNLYWGALSGIGTGLASAVLGAAVANRWFVARRGLVTGIFGAATSAGQLVFVPLLIWLVAELGWRASVVVLAAAAAGVLVPILLLMRDDPTDIGLQPYGTLPVSSVEASVMQPVAAPAQSGHTMRRAIQTSEFWLLSSTFFVCGATSNGLIGTHLIPHAVDHGISQLAAGSVLALMGTMNFVGTICSGYLTDRFNPRKLLACYYGFRGLSLFMLPFVTDVRGLSVFAILFGLDYIATVPPTVALVADIWGRKQVGTVFGWIFCAHQVGAAAAAWLGGVARDRLNDYGTAFLVAGFLAMMAAMLALRIGRGPQAERPTAPVGLPA